jgi:hypothetical protein
VSYFWEFGGFGEEFKKKLEGNMGFLKRLEGSV